MREPRFAPPPHGCVDCQRRRGCAAARTAGACATAQQSTSAKAAAAAARSPRPTPGAPQPVQTASNTCARIRVRAFADSDWPQQHPARSGPAGRCEHALGMRYSKRAAHARCKCSTMWRTVTDRVPDWGSRGQRSADNREVNGNFSLQGGTALGHTICSAGYAAIASTGDTRRTQQTANAVSQL